MAVRLDPIGIIGSLSLIPRTGMGGNTSKGDAGGPAPVDKNTDDVQERTLVIKSRQDVMDWKTRLESQLQIAIQNEARKIYDENDEQLSKPHDAALALHQPSAFGPKSQRIAREMPQMNCSLGTRRSIRPSSWAAEGWHF